MLVTVRLPRKEFGAHWSPEWVQAVPREETANVENVFIR